MKVFYDRDADLSALNGRAIAVIGYGNQGRAQALNLRDSGARVIIGNLEDRYAQQARADGFAPVPIVEAVRAAGIVMVLIPDEVQKAVYDESIGPNLRPGMTLDFASGYNVHFGLIQPPADVDVIMVAPRTIGQQVRIAFEGGSGVNADLDVRQDATGTAWPTALALAKGIGCTRAGVFHTTFATEAELDLFAEQALWPALFDILLGAYEVLTEAGYPKEAVALELYASGEPSDIFRAMARQGLFEQMRLHSPTSQYGVLSRRQDATGSSEALRRRMKDALDYLRSGRFAQEFAQEQRSGYARFERLRTEASGHPINDADRAVRSLLAARTAAAD
ncbi:MAG: ketol-acid reductoisomerase [Acidobacteria bacterium]|nr:ketol-acid reductoisomerase [Acidobacteriota bacterium]